MKSKLHQFQESFSRAITTPFDFSGKKASVQTQHYPSLAVAEAADSHIKQAIAGLSVYNEQYWYRLLTILQKEFPLVEKLLGTWYFNQLATAYLVENPPAQPTLNLLGDTLDEFILKSHWHTSLLPALILSERDCIILSQAAALDFLFEQLLFEPDTAEPPEVESLTQPMLKPGVTLFRESFALLNARNNLASKEPSLKKIQKTISHYAIYNHGGKVLFQKLSPPAFRLLKIIQQSGNLDAGLAEAEKQFSPRQKATIEKKLQTWFRDWGSKGWFILPTH